MAIISKPDGDFGPRIFIFIENDIVLEKLTDQPVDDKDFLLTEEWLPKTQSLSSFIRDKKACDWYRESSPDYCAAMLKKECELSPKFIKMPLRHFFWLTKKDRELCQLGSLAARAHGFLRLREDYKYCPTCGGNLEDDTFFAAKKCSKCGKLLFPRIEPAIIVLVSKGDEILLAKNRNNGKGFYSCIAGFVEHGESAEQCVAREVMEETGLKVKNIRYAGSQAWPFPDQLMLAFYADYESGDIKIQEEELSDARWFKKDALPPVPPPGSVAYSLISGICQLI